MDDNTQPGTRVDGAFGRGTLSPDGNVLSLDFPQSQLSNLQPGTAPKVTPADIEAEIASEHYFTAEDGCFGAHCFKVDSETSVSEAAFSLGITPGPLELLTFCVLVLRNGFTVTGESACASPENFDAEVGRKAARAAAVAQMWKLLGFRLRDRLASAHPVLDASKLPERLESPSWQTSPAPVPVVAVDDRVKIVDRQVVHNHNDFTYAVDVTGQRGRLCRVERAVVQPAGFSLTEMERKLAEASAKATEQVHAWFAAHDADGNALTEPGDRQQDA